MVGVLLRLPATALVVGHAEGHTGPETMIADRVPADGRLQPFLLGLSGRRTSVTERCGAQLQSPIAVCQP